MSKEHLATYLNDHLAGSVVAVEILENMTEEAPDLAELLTGLKHDVEADRGQLLAIMTRLDIPESRIRKVGSWLAERVAEAKLEVDDETNGPLRRLERLEALGLGIDGKTALWRALAAAAVHNPALAGPDYGSLIERAKEQRSRVEGARLHAAGRAFAPTLQSTGAA